MLIKNLKALPFFVLIVLLWTHAVFAQAAPAADSYVRNAPVTTPPVYRNQSEKNAISLSTLTGIELGGEVSGYRYQEHLDAGVDFMHETGTKVGLIGTATKALHSGFFGTIDARVAYSTNDYSSPVSGTQSNIPDYLGEIRLLGGKDFVENRFALSPYTGIGYRTLFNDSRGFTSNFSSGYRRDSQYLYLPAGLTSRFRATGTSRISANLEYDYLLEGWQESKLGDSLSGLPTLKNDQHRGYGLRGSVAYEWSHWGVGPFFDYWNINQSNIICGVGSVYGVCGAEPHNQTIEYGLQARYRF